MDGGASPLWNKKIILDAAGVKRCVFHLGYLKAPPRVVVGGPSLKISPDIALTLETCSEIILYSAISASCILNILIYYTAARLCITLQYQHEVRDPDQY